MKAWKKARRGLGRFRVTLVPDHHSRQQKPHPGTPTRLGVTMLPLDGQPGAAGLPWPQDAQVSGFWVVWVWPMAVWLWFG